MRTDQFAGHAQAADVAGRNRGIGPGPQHAFGKLALRRARHNAHLGEALAHDYGYHQIVFIERQGGDQALGAAQVRPSPERLPR